MKGEIVWTHFYDMHSGGEQKLKWEHIFIEAPKEEAKVIFYNRFKRNPEKVTCTCCGEDFSISEAKSLEDATAFHRNCDWEGERYLERPRYKGSNYMTLEEYLKTDEALAIRASDIQESERHGDVPEQGYVWVD